MNDLIMMELKTIYEGPAGPSSSKILHRTTLIVTNRTVEIEHEGADLMLTLVTLGFWYFACQSASIEIYELSRIDAIYLSDDVIIGEIKGKSERSCNCDKKRFVIDTPDNSTVQTKDLFFALKEVRLLSWYSRSIQRVENAKFVQAWTNARRAISDMESQSESEYDDDSIYSSDNDSESELMISNSVGSTR
jgi:hypothetical protein